MNAYLPEFLAVAGLHLLAVVSPGPDFAVVSQASLTRSRKAGVWTALGVSLGILVHVAFGLVGIGLLMSRSPALFTTVRLLGAGYLLNLGWKCLRPAAPGGPSEGEGRRDALGPGAALRLGFLTNALNPKATLFFLSLFTQIIGAATPAGVRLLYGAEMALMTFAWFALVAALLTVGGVARRVRKAQAIVERAMGVALIGLGASIFVAALA